MSERTATYIFAAFMGIPVAVLLARMWWHMMKTAIGTWKEKD